VPLHEQLRALCRAYVTDEEPSWSPPADPDAFLGLARRHQLTPLLWGLLGRRLPRHDPLGKVLRRDFYAAVARAFDVGALAGDVLRALGAGGVPVIVLKGAVLADAVYRDPAHRPMRDIDLLVRRDDVPRVLEHAAALGLRRYEDRHSLAFDLRSTPPLSSRDTPTT
jgi:hypothetical protein